jgi:L-ascorbate metabolism protein UlaG (beta-lactamase superfamily)
MADVQTLFLGTSTVLITDGESSILVDGFLSRPSLRRLLTGVRPDEAAIGAALRRAGIDRLDVVAVSHSHVDHALDAPIVADKTGTPGSSGRKVPTPTP